MSLGQAVESIVYLESDGKPMGDLVPNDLETGVVLPSAGEAAEMPRDVGKAAREAAETRAAELEAEIQRLRAELRRPRSDT